MKKNRINILLIIILIAFAAYLFITNKRGTIPKELKDFAIEDTSTVDRIFMVNKENQQVLLERTNAVWMVNKKYFARNDAINLLLKTLNRIDIKAPVAKSMFETVVGNLAVKSVKVEIYQKGELTKTYYVGGPTKDQYGTYMLLKNSSHPFILHIKGFRGYLTPRYFIDENQWRDRTLFRYGFNQIASVTVEQPANIDESFKVFNLGNNKFKLESLDQSISIRIFDTIKVKQYIAAFKRISFDSFVKYIDEKKKDSILAASPHYIISLEERNGDIKKLKTFYRPNDGLLDSKGELLKYDPDHEYAITGDDDELLLIQYYVFHPLFKNLSYFQPKITK